jgi:hypothetical protein
LKIEKLKEELENETDEDFEKQLIEIMEPAEEVQIDTF